MATCNRFLAAAIASYNTAIQLKPSYPDAHWNCSLAMLLSGDYKNGWEKYNWRTKITKTASNPHALPKCNQWSDKTALNRTSQLLLVTEQGLGDALQFIRYAIALKDQGIMTTLCAQPKLHSLIQASGIDSSPLTPQQANQITKGQWIHLLSLPGYLEVSPAGPIVTQPYIKTTDELIEKWAGILSSEQRPIIAINWQGEPRNEKIKHRGRSLAGWRPLPQSLESDRCPYSQSRKAWQ